MNAAAVPLVAAIGEILWDLFPQGARLGGAPYNFLFHCRQLAPLFPATQACQFTLVTRVGDDARGQAIRELLQPMQSHWATNLIQIDPDHPTGSVSVQLDPRGVPQYTIHTEVAYDYLAWDERLTERCPQVVYFGTLAQRHPVARRTIAQLLDCWSLRVPRMVLDLNLRPNCYSPTIIEQSLHRASWLKLSEEELGILRRQFALPTAETAALRALRQRFQLELVMLTYGAAGCQVQASLAGQEFEVAEPGVPTQVVDTVGAGDAFTAAMVLGLLEGGPERLPSVVHLANRYAARVVGASGATPTLAVEEFKSP